MKMVSDWMTLGFVVDRAKVARDGIIAISDYLSIGKDE